MMCITIKPVLTKAVAGQLPPQDLSIFVTSDTAHSGDVLARYPRLGLAEEFIAAFEDQATRKPRCLAAQFVRNGLAARLAANPLEHEARHGQSEALG